MTPVEYAFYVFVTCSAILIVPGPIFFLSLNEGMKSLRGGVMMIVGVLTAESILLILLHIGFILVLQHILPMLRIVGTLLLIVLGILALRSGVKGVTTDSNNLMGASYTRGFLLTFINPPFILWFLTVGSSLLETGINELGSFAFIIFSLILLTSSILVMVAIILSVHGGKRLIGMRELRFLSIISGTGFIIIAIILFMPLINT